MDVNSTSFNGYLESQMTTDPEATINNYDSYKYFFIPILLIQIIATIISNGVLLMMIGRSLGSCTSLNIFLLSVSVFNLLTIVNQISLVVFTFQTPTTALRRQLCQLMTIIRTSTTTGTIFLHLFISYHRFKIVVKPLKWKKRRKQAWLLGTVTWAIACAVAIFECILHYNNGNRVTLQRCLWPGISECTNAISVYSQLLTLACLSAVSGITCYFYRKASRILKEIEVEKEFELRRSSTTISTRQGKRKLTTPERAVVSLFTIFTIHCITQLPTYIYGIIVSTMALRNHINEAAGTDEDSPTSVVGSDEDAPASVVGSVPILLLLATISFLTTCSPLVLSCINSKFKQHIKSILEFITGSGDHTNKEKFLHQIQAKFPLDPTPSPSPVPPPDPAPSNTEIFYGNSKHSKFKSNKANYVKPGNSLEVPGATCSSRPERVSGSSLYVGRSPRPSRVSTTQSSVGIAAVNAGLALSAPGHRVLLNNFFPLDPPEMTVEELVAINFL